MSEVFSDAPTPVPASSSATTATTDLESQGMPIAVILNKEEEYAVASEVTTIPQSSFNKDDQSTLSRSHTTNPTPAAAAAATAKKGGRASQFFLSYTNIVTLTIVISMFIAAIYGILDATGAFDKEKSSPPQQQQDNLANDEILNVCSLQSSATGNNSNNNNGFDIRGDGSLLLRQYINTGDDTVTVQLEYYGIGWIALAFSESKSMVPNTAIIALPDENIVQKYSLSSKSLAGVTPLESSFQTLTDTTVTQVDGRTIMTFTKKLVEPDEVAVIPGTNQFNWAIGSSNTLAFHASRGSASLKFDLCLENGGNNNNNNNNNNKSSIVPISTIAPTAPVQTPTFAPMEPPTLAPIPAPVGYSY